MPPDLVDAVAQVGALGFAIIAVWAFATGRVRPGTLVDRREAQLERQLDTAYNRVDRFIDLIEGATGIKAPK